MTPREAYKVGFLLRCADEGLSPEQTADRAEAARMLKSAVGGEVIRTAGERVGALADYVPWLMLGGLGLTGGLGWGVGSSLANTTKNPEALEEAKADEVLAEYGRQIERVRRAGRMRQGATV